MLLGATRQVAQTGDLRAVFGNPEVSGAEDRAHSFDLETCRWAKVEVSGRDYSFSGVARRVKSGPISFEFTNDGEEPHELVLFKVNDGVKETVAQIIDLPEEEARARTIPLDSTFAEPGQGDHLVIDLTPGRYGFACFVPVGGGDEGPPHASRGMHAEFEVV